MISVNLCSSEALIETPFIKVDIGDYTFGVYRRDSIGAGQTRISYPDYVQKLTVDKINGTVNRYTLEIAYPITPDSDPNFFEKVFSSVSNTRKIVFSYGDFSVPHYIYADEEALITDVTTRLDMQSARITYTVKAVSSAALSLGGNYTFTKKVAQPSRIIREILYGGQYNLLSVFTGMQDKAKVDQAGLLAADDKVVTIEMQQNMSPFDYITYLVSCMSPSADTTTGSVNRTLYCLAIDEDRENLFGGPYFKIQKVQRNTASLDAIAAYTVDIGYPGKNVVVGFDVENQQGYSILYDYNNEISSYNYGKRIDDNGNLSYVYAPPLTSSKQLHLTTEYDKYWWTKMTEFPIKVTMTIKGLLKPAVLMSYVKVNVWFFGRKHVTSGYYIITAQKDEIGMSGFKTTLSLLRVAPDGDIETSAGLFGETVVPLAGQKIGYGTDTTFAPASKLEGGTPTPSAFLPKNQTTKKPGSNSNVTNVGTNEDTGTGSGTGDGTSYGGSSRGAGAGRRQSASSTPTQSNMQNTNTSTPSENEVVAIGKRRSDMLKVQYDDNTVRFTEADGVLKEPWVDIIHPIKRSESQW